MQIYGLCLKRSQLYPLFTALHLQENMRLSALQGDAKADQAAMTLPSFLLSVDEIKLQNSSPSLISLPPCISVDKDVKKPIPFVFPNLKNNYLDDIWLSERALLTTRKANLEKLNSWSLDTR